MRDTPGGHQFDKVGDAVEGFVIPFGEIERVKRIPFPATHRREIGGVEQLISFGQGGIDQLQNLRRPRIAADGNLRPGKGVPGGGKVADPLRGKRQGDTRRNRRGDGQADQPGVIRIDGGRDNRELLIQRETALERLLPHTLRETDKEIAARPHQRRRKQPRRHRVIGLRHHINLDPAQIILGGILGEGPVTSASRRRAVPDADLLVRIVRSRSSAPPVVGEQRLLSAGIVHLERAVIARRHPVAEVIGASARPRHIRRVLRRIAAGPKLNIALLRLAFRHNVTPNLQVGNRLLEDRAAGHRREGDLSGVLREGVHRDPEVLQVPAGLANLHVIGDPADRPHRLVAVHRIRHRIGPIVGFRSGKVHAVDQLIGIEFRSGHIVFRPLLVGAGDGIIGRGERGGSELILKPADRQGGCHAIRDRAGKRERDGPQITRKGGRLHRDSVVQRIIRERGDRIRQQAGIGLEGDSRGGHRVVALGDDRGLVVLIVLRGGDNGGDRLKPRIRHLPVTRNRGMEAIEEVIEGQPGIHVEEVDPLSLGTVRRDAFLHKGVEIVLDLGLVGCRRPVQDRRRDDMGRGLHLGDPVDQQIPPVDGRFETVVPGVVCPDMEQDDMGIEDSAEGGLHILIQATPAAVVGDAPSAMPLMLHIRQVPRIGGDRPDIIHRIARIRQ